MSKAMTIELSDKLVDKLSQLVDAGLYASEREAILAAVEELLGKRYREPEEQRQAKLRAFVRAQREGRPRPVGSVSDEEWAAIKRKLAESPPFETWQDAMRAIRKYTN